MGRGPIARPPPTVTGPTGTAPRPLVSHDCMQTSLL